MESHITATEPYFLDAHHKVGSFTYTYGVFIVPKIRAHEWLFASEEGQWQIVETSKAARLVMVFLDSSHSHVKIEAIQKDLSPLVKSLAPTKDDSEYEIPFMMASDGIAQRKIVHQATSKTTGLIIVEDVIYDNADGKSPDNRLSENMIFRRLICERSSGLVQSEALLTTDSKSDFHKLDGKQTSLSSKSRKKGLGKESILLYHLMDIKTV
ncbi:hypothetical protein HPP92_024546 [Vanilla planifolia]|uniref:Uncharacterized protein n=1 Tax=Vanilla planifolia TaxID=51239 RepID=A0A835PL15_VANPL|nr:hypothetical protein HPP92_024546 [Vanilla planifolia]